MTLNEFISLANKIRKMHPEAGDAEMWVVHEPDVHVKCVAYDQKHKPARIKLSEH